MYVCPGKQWIAPTGVGHPEKTSGETRRPWNLRHINHYFFFKSL